MSAVEGLAAAALGTEVVAARPVSGGDINDAFAVELGDGTRAFLKTRDEAPPGEFETEAAGLRWLAEPGAVRVPGVLATVDPPDPRESRCLLLEWIEPGPVSEEGAERLGVGLAATHRAGAPAHGSPPPGADRIRIGPIEMPVPAEAPEGERSEAGWAAHYAGERLIPLARLARERGALDASGAAAVERVCARIAELAGPPEPPARIHGDLWGGNVMGDRDGEAWLIDPAAQGGHREMDLAMLRLFGSASPRIFAAYEEAFPLADGAEERVALWQLQPLLVHAVLFGGSYGAAVERAARRYA